MTNDVYTTDGERYRTPVTPDIAHALGRAMSNFFGLEEMVVAILYEGNTMALSDARQLDAGKSILVYAAKQSAFGRTRRSRGRALTL